VRRRDRRRFASVRLSDFKVPRKILLLKDVSVRTESGTAAGTIELPYPERPTIGIFLPAFVWVAVSGPIIPRLRRLRTAVHRPLCSGGRLADRWRADRWYRN